MEEKLDEKILSALYGRWEDSPGKPEMTFGKLCEAIDLSLGDEKERNEFHTILLSLKENGYIEYGSLAGGKSGNVHLTPLGIEVAKGIVDCGSRESQPEPVSTTTSAQNESRRVAPCVATLDVPVTLPIPAGPFWMGNPVDDLVAYENEKPCKECTLWEYRIGLYPVTNVQYARYILATGQSAPKHWNAGKVPVGLEDHPVVNVNFEDAKAYCRWLSQDSGEYYRLPTEYEWEKAARGRLPEACRYPWGNEWRSGFCNTRELGRNGTTSVYEFEYVNRSPFGVIDMAGNVWEWTDSGYERYPDSNHKGLRYGKGYRVVRGGSWRNSCREARISCRGRYRPDVRRPFLGFRIASG